MAELILIGCTLVAAIWAGTVALRALEVERRPWLFPVFDPHDEDKPPMVRFINHGRSPGMLRYIHATRIARLDETEGRPDPVKPLPDPNFPLPYGGIAPPGEHSQYFAVRMIRARQTPLRSDTPHTNYIIGFVIYDDFFHNKYVTGFAYQLGSDGIYYLLSSFGRPEQDRYNYSRTWTYWREWRRGKPSWRWLPKLGGRVTVAITQRPRPKQA